jgi:hypothetical protein
MNDDEALDRELAKLGQRTMAVHPRVGFADRVLEAVQVENTTRYDREVLRSGRRFLPVAALAAVVALMGAALGESSTNAALAVADDPVEIAW